MLTSITLFTFFLAGQFVFCYGLNTLIPRINCYPAEQPNCNVSFLEVYTNLSTSYLNDSVADTYFFLFTRRNQDKPEKLHKCAGKLPNDTNFNPKKKLIIIFTPYQLGFCDVAIYREWMVQLLIKDDFNILVIDYNWGNQLDYGATIMNAKKVVKYQTITVIRNIQKQTGIPTEEIILIGHSLGAHLAGFVGQEIHPGVIIGVDPAGPGFPKSLHINDRLDCSDAAFVMVLHTNAGDCLPYLGINYDAGHVDFYINGGKMQEACFAYTFISFLKGDFYYAIRTAVLPNLCFHDQSSQYFKVSINPGDCQFVGVKCKNYEEFKAGKCRTCGKNGENCLIMGFDTYKYYKRNSTCYQRYYVETTYECPYCDDSMFELEGYKSIYESSLQQQ